MFIKTLLSQEFQKTFVKLIDSDEAIPIKLGLKILNLKDYLEEQAKHGIELRNKIIRKHCEKDEEGNLKVVDGNYEINQTPEFLSEWNDFLNCEIHIPEYLKLNKEEIFQLNLNLTVKELQILIEILE